MDQSSLFRKSALDKLASPERLDVLMRVTSPMGWLALATIGVVLAGVIVWSFVGDIPKRVSATGMLTQGEGSGQITAMASGTLAEVFIENGDEVEVDQIVARISVTAADEESIRLKGEQVRQLEIQNDRDKARLNDEIAQINLNMTDWDVIIARRTQERNDKQQEWERLDAGVRGGTIERIRADAVKDEISRLDDEITGLTQKKRTATGQIATKRGLIQSGDSRVTLARQELAALRAGQVSNSNIESSFRGRISQVIKRRGDTVTAGEPIAFIGDASAAMQVQLFVAAADWNLVEPGKRVEISHPAFPSEEYGLLLGRVATVGELPAASTEIQRVMSSGGGVQEIIEQNAHLVAVELLLDPGTSTGFEWSGSGGPADTLAPNTPVTGSIITNSRRPIELIIPMLRSVVGG